MPKAVQFDSYGGIDVLEVRDVPTASKGFKGSVQSRVSDTQRAAFEDLDLGRLTHHQHICRDVSELFHVIARCFVHWPVAFLAIFQAQRMLLKTAGGQLLATHQSLTMKGLFAVGLSTKH